MKVGFILAKVCNKTVFLLKLKKTSFDKEVFDTMIKIMMAQCIGGRVIDGKTGKDMVSRIFQLAANDKLSRDRNVVLNLEGIDFIGAYITGLLLIVHQNLRAHGKKILFESPSPHLKDFLKYFNENFAIEIVNGVIETDQNDRVITDLGLDISQQENSENLEKIRAQDIADEIIRKIFEKTTELIQICNESGLPKNEHIDAIIQVLSMLKK
jgi:anti-anti-sigma regulatory factor